MVRQVQVSFSSQTMLSGPDGLRCSLRIRLSVCAWNCRLYRVNQFQVNYLLVRRQLFQFQVSVIRSYRECHLIRESVRMVLLHLFTIHFRRTWWLQGFLRVCLLKTCMQSHKQVVVLPTFSLTWESQELLWLIGR